MWHRRCYIKFLLYIFKSESADLPFQCANCKEVVREQEDTSLSSSSTSFLGSMSLALQSTRILDQTSSVSASFDPPTFQSDATLEDATDNALGYPSQPYREPESFQEPTLIQQTPNAVVVEEGALEVQWEVVSGASERGGDQLANTLGYTYNVKERRQNGNIVWVCSKKSKGCKARVTQTAGAIFTPGSMIHTCTPTSGVATVLKVRVASKTDASNNPFTSAMKVVKKVLLLLLLFI